MVRIMLYNALLGALMDALIAAIMPIINYLDSISGKEKWKM
jgi:hypothetical protein